MKTFTSHSLDETRKIAEEILGALKANGKEATVLGLSGHLGSGKTAFTKEAAKVLGIKEEVTSPTFVIMKIYEIPESAQGRPAGHARRLIHIDAYRLENGKELEALKFEQLVGDPHNLIFIEWPENVKEALTGLENHSTATFSIPPGAENERSIIFSNGDISTQ